MSQSRMDGNVLEGIISYPELASNYSWAKNKPTYRADNNAIKLIAEHAPDLTFIIVLGTWCSDSREHVPIFYHIAQQAGIADSNMQFIGTLRNKRTNFIDLEPMCIEYVPTFFVFYRGVIIGKIVESPATYIESDIATMLKKHLDIPGSIGK
jgi:hypothetical protein